MVLRMMVEKTAGPTRRLSGANAPWSATPHHFIAMVQFAAALQKHLERLRHVNLTPLGNPFRKQYFNQALCSKRCLSAFFPQRQQL
jgi:type VI protein secretion system component VasF